MNTRRNGHVLIFLGVLLVMGAIAWIGREQGIDTAPSAPTAQVRAVDHKQATPGTSHDEPPPKSLKIAAIITPYELLRNTFQYQGKVIQLQYRSLPVLYESGQFFIYNRALAAMNFNRMLSPREALYDVLAETLHGSTRFSSASSDVSVIGQLLVELPIG